MRIAAHTPPPASIIGLRENGAMYFFVIASRIDPNVPFLRVSCAFMIPVI